MDAVDDAIGPQAPVGSGPHAVRVPGGADQTGTTIRQRLQKELSLTAIEVMIQMRRMNAIGTPLAHRFRLLGDAEAQARRSVTNVDRLDKGSGGKDTMPHGADAG